MILPLKQLLGVFREEVCFEIDDGSCGEGVEIGGLDGVGSDPEGGLGVLQFGDGEGDAVYGE